jgi:hypothetical protein
VVLHGLMPGTGEKIKKMKKALAFCKNLLYNISRVKEK